MLPADVSGKRFGRLVIGTRAGTRNRCAMWNAVCDCGAKVVVSGASAARGHTLSCGCLRRETCAATGRQGELRAKHWHTWPGGFTTTYSTWHAMTQRCTNRNNTHYRDYGGRGIVVCRRWHSFANFLADMGEKPTGLTLDRKNNDGNYSKRNCRWATQSEQLRNRRSRERVAEDRRRYAACL